MTVSVSLDLVGLVAFSGEGTKIGKLKDVISDGESTPDYLVIGRFLARDLVIPADVVEMPGDRIVVPFASSFLNCAPAVNTKGAMSPEERGSAAELLRCPHYVGGLRSDLATQRPRPASNGTRCSQPCRCRRRPIMNHVDLVAAAAGGMVTVAAIILGAWLDLRPGKHHDEPREKALDR